MRFSFRGLRSCFCFLLGVLKKQQEVIDFVSKLLKMNVKVVEEIYRLL